MGMDSLVAIIEHTITVGLTTLPIPASRYLIYNNITVETGELIITVIGAVCLIVFVAQALRASGFMPAVRHTTPTTHTMLTTVWAISSSLFVTIVSSTLHASCYFL